MLRCVVLCTVVVPNKIQDLVRLGPSPQLKQPQGEAMAGSATTHMLPMRCWDSHTTLLSGAQCIHYSFIIQLQRCCYESSVRCVDCAHNEEGDHKEAHGCIQAELVRQVAAEGPHCCC